MSVLTVKNLNKYYASFRLSDVSFTLEEGRIMGFIGRNGAGKTTTIKSILGLIHTDSGEIETVPKEEIGYSTGTINWYPRKKIKDIVAVTKKFFSTWDDNEYQKYLKIFDLDENKMPVELSEGMKVKVNLLIALSHHAKLLILDEPTSGLDPFSRDELLEIFMKLKKEGVSVFFSTHIISDIEKCADDIVYISEGRIITALSKEEFIKTNSMEGENLEETFLRLERGVRGE